MKIRSLSILCAFLFSFPFFPMAQNEGNIWYFGENAGIDFNSGSPVSLTNSAMNTIEGCASISTASGHIQFYTNGIAVWDSTHTAMPNGTGLLGDESSTQSGIIVPVPQSDSLYYIFTVGENGANHFRYSIVDMSLHNGLGDIIPATKNVEIFDENNNQMSVTEKITSVLHSDNHSYWVIAHQAATNKFYVYLVDAVNGFNPAPTAYSVGTNHTSNWGATHGCMKISPGGEYIAVAVHSQNSSGFIEVFDFDRTTGGISNPRLASNYYRPYGVEFSPDGKKLYATSCNFPPNTTPSVIYQFDMEATVFSASSTVVHSSISDNMLGMQLGPDAKIYVALNFTSYLGVINNPNETAANCNYDSLGVYLNGKNCRYGLPTFIQSFFNLARIKGDGRCQNADIQFDILYGEGILSVIWDFDDPASGANNTSTLTQPTHVYAQPGIYNVSAILTYYSFIDTIFMDMTIYSSPFVDLGNDTAMALGDSIQLYTGPQSGDILWSTGDNTEYLTVTQPGIYSVTITNQWECEATDEISIQLLGLEEVENSKISVFPNPATDYLYILNRTSSALQYKIFDSVGNEVMDNRIDETRKVVDISKLPNGIYLMRFDTGKLVYSMKLLKL